MSSEKIETLGELAATLRAMIRRYIAYGTLVCAAIAVWLYVTDRPGSVGFFLIAAGSLMPLIAWSRQSNPGLPLAGLMGMQTLVIYGVPLVAQNPDILQFSTAEVTQASLEIGLFGFAMAMGWTFTSRRGGRRRIITYRRFTMLRGANLERTARLAPMLLGLGVAFQLSNILGFLGILPGGLFPVVRTLADAASVGGGVLGGYFIGRRILKASGMVFFWLLLIGHCFLTAANYTLFPAVSLLVSVFVGMFIGGGRLPVVVTVIIVSVFAFFNLSKFEMRARYWEPGAAYAYQQLSDLPSRYEEWYDLSYEMLTRPKDEFSIGERPRIEQKLSNRINNLINLLIAQDAVMQQGIEPLHGETYAIIPVLFIPRLFWPDKPRTHEGMVLLNVHFGRQTRAESLVTYISWGLLPEAYGNFGTYFGALICGIVLGCAMGWLEQWFRPFPLTSLEALVFFLLLVQFGTSFELVASVWLTSIFQMLVGVFIGTYPFVEKVRLPAADS